jgi:transposase InsO family protein
VATVQIKDKKSSTIVRMFTYQILPFLPRLSTNLLTDNGPEFTSHEFSTFVQNLSIKHKLTTPYQPTSNGAMERVNRTIKNLIRSLSDAGRAWEESLPRAVITYNNTIHVELGVSPADFLLKRSHDPDNVIFPDY